MPATYNGIGTHYYGKKNLESRPGVCRFCGRSCDLSSYDTRLWFVLFFIPLIPLGRKRIIDYCPGCTRHVAMELDKWETAKQLEISGALERFRSNPTPETAIEAHQQLVIFHQMGQADEFRQMMSQKYADNAKVQSYLGAALAHFGKFDEAGGYFARALELRADLPEARVGVAQSLMRAGRLDEARKLLDFLEKPGAHQLYPLGPLEQLADAYQQQARHAQALELYAKLQEAFPDIANHPGFRKRVQQSEKALGQTETALPKRKFSWRRFFGRDRSGGQPAVGPVLTWRGVTILGCIAAAVLIFMAISNEYIRRHRTLFIVNAFDTPANVDVPGVGTVQATRGVNEFVVPEGRHRVSVTGPLRQEVDCELRSSYFSRWFGDPAWVLNVGGAAVLLFESVTYSQNPSPGTASFHFGEAFQYFPKVNNPFRSLPASVQIKSGEQRLLTRLDVFRGQMPAVFYHFQRHGQIEQALRFAEWRLRHAPEEMELLRPYANVAAQHQQLQRVEQFLRQGLTNRPVQIEWHRLYQGLRRDRHRDAQLAMEYDRMLQSEPTNSSLLYLRGRVASDHADARRWFERASASDPRNGYPLYAMAYDKAALGDWAGARKLLASAVQFQPNGEGFIQALTQARFALGEHAEIEREARERLKREPLNYALMVHLCDALIAQGRTNELPALQSNFDRGARSRYPEQAAEVINPLHRHVLYSTGNFEALEKHAAKDRSNSGRAALFHALIEQGRVAEALKTLPPEGPPAADPFHQLTISIAWRAAGDVGEADQWLARAIKTLGSGDDDDVRAAAVLRRDAEPSQAELNEVILTNKHKAILLAALAQRHGALGVELAGAARRLNVSRDYPYHLIQRVTARAL